MILELLHTSSTYIPTGSDWFSFDRKAGEAPRNRFVGQVILKLLAKLAKGRSPLLAGGS